MKISKATQTKLDRLAELHQSLKQAVAYRGEEPTLLQLQNQRQEYNVLSQEIIVIFSPILAQLSDIGWALQPQYPNILDRSVLRGWLDSVNVKNLNRT
jgi:hypothetical protein